MRLVIQFYSLIFIILLLSNKSYSQGEGNIWYFGIYAGIDFNSGHAVPLTNSALNTSEGCSVMCDSTGNLLFYTDGITVYNRNHGTMWNGTDLLGNSTSSQSAIIVKDPGNSSRYYIFTIGPWGSGVLAYTAVDMDLNSGLGDIDTGTKNIILQDSVSEKLTAIPHSNGTDYWIITQAHGTSKYYSYLLSSSGVNSNAIISSPGGIVQTGGGLGYLKANHTGNKIASAIMNCSTVEVYDFDNSSGILSNAITLSSCPSAYGVEFSPNDQILYYSTQADMSIYQVDMITLSPQNISGAINLIKTFNKAPGAIQLANDGKIYIAKFMSEYLAVINNPNSWGTSCNVETDGFFLSGRLSRLGLPNFLPELFVSYEFNYSNTCNGDSTFLYIINPQNIDSVLWNFDDPQTGNYNTSTLFSPYHIFTSAGIYDVELTTFSSGVAVTTTQQLTIYSLPHPNLGPDTSMCIGGSVILDAGSIYNSYIWSTGDTTQTLEVFEIGTYNVTVTDNQGCSASDDNNVTLVPNVSISSNIVEGCEPLTVDFNSVYSAQSYIWDFGDGTDVVHGYSPSHTYIYPGIYSITLTLISYQGCINSLTENNLIVVYENPTANFSFDPELTNILKPKISFTNLSENYTSSYWDFGDGKVSYADNPFHDFPANIGKTYKVRLIIESNKGCLDTAYNEVSIKNVYTIYAPTAFSPNFDGINDIFYIYANGIDNDNFNLNIYDRWGEIIYESQDVYNGWDGRSKNGNLVKSGSYTWLCSYKNIEGKSYQETGSITVIR